MNRKQKLQKVKRKFKMYKHPIVQRMAMMFIHGGKTAEAQEILQGVSDICDQNNALVDEFNRLNNMTAQELLDKVKDVRVNEVAKLLADGKDPPPMLRSEIPIIVPVQEIAMPVDDETGLPFQQALYALRGNLERWYPEIVPVLKSNVQQDIIEGVTFTKELDEMVKARKGNAKVYDAENKEVEPTPVNGGA